jgi:NAD+ kinase
MIPPKRIGVVANAQKPDALNLARQAVAELHSRNVDVLVQHEIAAILGAASDSASDHTLASSDVVIVFGGDGTVLSTSHRCSETGTPMLGINLGRFGFLNDVAPDMLIPVLDRLLIGDCDVEERMMIRCELTKPNGLSTSESALNDVVVAHSTLSRVLHLAVEINGKYLTTYSADGIIFATPTGSTAYSLSAGGPLVHPAVDVVLITPICAHTLNTRTLLVPADHEITVTVEEDFSDGIAVTADGQRFFHMLGGETLSIKKADRPARLITQIGGASFYEKLQTKLQWGTRVAN